MIEGWISQTDEDGVGVPYGDLLCDICGDWLKKWYEDVINSLKNFLPKDFQPTCCNCAFKRAIGIKECPECGGSISSGWLLKHLDSMVPGTWCMECSWTAAYTIEESEKMVRDYLSSLW